MSLSPVFLVTHRLNELKSRPQADASLPALRQRWEKLSFQESRPYERLGLLDESRFISECTVSLFQLIYTQETSSDSAGQPLHHPQRRLKKFRNAYMHFYVDQRAEHRARNPGISSSELSKLMGEVWRKMRPQERRVYEERSRLEREDYKRRKKSLQESELPPEEEIPDRSR